MDDKQRKMLAGGGILAVIGGLLLYGKEASGENGGNGEEPIPDNILDNITFSNFNPDHYPQMGEMFNIRIDTSWPVPIGIPVPDPITYPLTITGAVNITEDILIRPKVTETHTIQALCDFEGPQKIYCEGFEAEVIGEASYTPDPDPDSPQLPSYVWCPYCKQRFYDRDYPNYDPYPAMMTHLIKMHGPPADQYDTSGTGGIQPPNHLLESNGYVVEELWRPLLDALRYTRIGDPAATDQDLENLRSSFERDMNRFYEVLNSPPPTQPPDEGEEPVITSSTLLADVPYGDLRDIIYYAYSIGIDDAWDIIYNYSSKARAGVGDYKYMTVGDVAPGYYVGWND